MNDFEAMAREFLQGKIDRYRYVAALESMIEKADQRAERAELSRREHLQSWTAENHNIGPCPKCESRKISVRVVDTIVKNHGNPRNYFSAEAECTTCWYRIEPIRVSDSGRMTSTDIEALNISWFFGGANHEGL